MTQESLRLNDLSSYSINKDVDDELDTITKLAASICNVPISMINIVHNDMQQSKSIFGLSDEYKYISREDSFCTHTIQYDKFFQVENPKNDSRFSENPLVNGDLALGFYAGIPLRTPAGFNLGALCVIDNKERKLDKKQIEALEYLSKLAVSIIDSKKPLNKISKEASDLEKFVFYLCPYKKKITYANIKALEFLGYTEDELYNMAPEKVSELFFLIYNTEDDIKSQEDNEKIDLSTLVLKDKAKYNVVFNTNVVNYNEGIVLVAIADKSESVVKELISKKEREIFFDSSANLLFIANNKYEIIEYNSAFNEIFGERLNGYSNVESVLDFDCKKISELSGENDSFSFSSEINKSCEEYKIIEWSAKRHPNNRYYFTGQDKTKEYKDKERLNLFEKVFLTSQNPIIISNLSSPSGIVEYVNDAFTDCTGYKPEEVVGRNCGFLQNQDRDQEEIKDLKKNMAEGKPSKNLLRNYRKDGSLFWNQLYLSPVNDLNGNLTHYIGIQYDVSDLIAHEERTVRLNRIGSMASVIKDKINNENNIKNIGRSICHYGTLLGGYYAVCFGKSYEGNDEIITRSFNDSGNNKDLRNEDLNELIDDIDSELKDDDFFNSKKIKNLISDQIKKINNGHLNHKISLLDEKDSGTKLVVAQVDFETNDEKHFFVCASLDQSSFDEREIHILSDLLLFYKNRIETIEKQNTLDKAKNWDSVTGLANENFFLKLAESHLLNNEISEAIVIYINASRINQVSNQENSELLQRQISNRLNEFFPPDAVLGKISRSGFSASIPNTFKYDEDIYELIKNVIHKIFDPHFGYKTKDSWKYRLTPKVGFDVVNLNNYSITQGLLNSEIAAEQSDNLNTIVKYYPEMSEKQVQIVKLESELKSAIQNNEFILHYQPKYNIKSEKITSCEALMRWKHPTEGMVSPGKFINLLESSGLIKEMTPWLLNEAYDTAVKLSNIAGYNVRVAINISPIQLNNDTFNDEIDNFITHNNITPKNNLIDLEITEGVLVEDINSTKLKLENLTSLGFRISIDDFGTGYSSLSYLTSLKYEHLKIDISFIRLMMESSNDMALVSSIINLGRSMDKTLIAEGVENIEQAKILRLLNCHEIQGYLISKPDVFSVIEKLFSEKKLINFN